MALGDIDSTEYGSEWDGFMRSTAAKSIIELTRIEATKQERSIASKQIHRFFPTRRFFIKTPTNDAWFALRWFIHWMQKWQQANAETHPMGRGIRYVDFDERKRTEYRDPIVLDPDALIDHIGSEYKTIVGEVRPLARGVVVEHKPWLPDEAYPETEFARSYTKECRALQATKAGRKAKRLLLDHLSPDQIDSYMRKGYFFVSPPKKKDEEKPKLYVIERGNVCANTLYVKPKRAKNGQIHLYPEKRRCLIAKEPHPVDDILLTQKMIIETDEDYFLKESRTFEPWYPNQPFQKSLTAI